MAKLVFDLSILAAIVGADKCISIDDKGTGCADCPAGPGDKVEGSQCIRGGAHWYTCYTNVEACCKDGQISWKPENSKCVSNYKPNDDKPTSTPKPVTDCDKVVAKSASSTNSACQARCRDIQLKGGKGDSDYTDNCMTEHYSWGNGRAQLSGKCFDSWVHGYIEPAKLAGYRTIYDVMTPALCQKACQEDDDCVRFAWITPEGQSGSASTANSCILKNQKQIEVPASIVYEKDENPENYAAKYCNFRTSWQCFNGYRCAPCEGGKKSCIWGTDEHILGWKYCPSSDVCKVPKPYHLTSTTTTTPETTTTTKRTTTTPETTTTKRTTTTPETTTTTTTTKRTTTTPETTTTTTRKSTTTPRSTTGKSTTSTETDTATTTETDTATTTETDTATTTETDTATTTETVTATTTETDTATTTETRTATTTETDTATTTETNTDTTTETDTATTTECKHTEDCHDCCHGRRPDHDCKPHCRPGCHPDCERIRKDAHGIALRIHDKPKHIRIAVDN